MIQIFTRGMKGQKDSLGVDYTHISELTDKVASAIDNHTLLNRDRVMTLMAEVNAAWNILIRAQSRIDNSPANLQSSINVASYLGALRSYYGRLSTLCYGDNLEWSP